MFKNFFKKLKAKRETDEELFKRIYALSDDESELDPQVALKELKRFFLGNDWYVVDPMNQKQCNVWIVYDIERFNLDRRRDR